MKALIVGGARDALEDVAKALALFAPDAILAVNDIGIHLDRVDHWVTMHPDKMEGWAKARAEAGRSPPQGFWTAAHKKAPASFRTVLYVGGGSAMTAVLAAREVGATRIVLAGVPLTPTPHFHCERPWHARECEHYRKAWMRQKKELLADTRSLSGWTAELIGTPTRDWIESRG